MLTLRSDELDRVIEDLQRALDRCDATGVGLVASVHLDLALHLAVRERAEMAVDRSVDEAVPG